MTPEQISTVTACHLQGIPQAVIAQRIGVTRETVNRNLRRPDVRERIEAEAEQIINRGLSQARRTLTRLAAMGNVKDTDKDHLKLALDASKHITSIAGLSGTSPSTVINALIQVNQHGQVPAAIASILSRLSADEAIEGEIECEDISSPDTHMLCDNRTPTIDVLCDHSTLRCNDTNDPNVSSKQGFELTSQVSNNITYDDYSI